MPIRVNLDVMLACRKVRGKQLAAAIGITAQNLSILKTGRARALRFSTLEAICRELRCQPGDLLEYRDDDGAEAEHDRDPPRRGLPQAPDGTPK